MGNIVVTTLLDSNDAAKSQIVRIFDKYNVAFTPDFASDLFSIGVLLLNDARTRHI
jgi:hypothetical protein